MKPPFDPEIAARRELSTPFRYHLGNTPVQRSWLQWLFERASRWWHMLVSHFHGSARVESVLGDIVLIVLVALALYAVVRVLLVFSLRRSVASGDIESLIAERPEHRLAREAGAAADRGDFITAVRFILQAAISLLDLRGSLHDDASATLFELRRQAHALGDSIATPFSEIANAYTLGVYARRTLEESAWLRSRTAYEALRSSRG